MIRRAVHLRELSAPFCVGMTLDLGVIVRWTRLALESAI